MACRQLHKVTIESFFGMSHARPDTNFFTNILMDVGNGCSISIHDNVANTILYGLAFSFAV